MACSHVVHNLPNVTDNEIASYANAFETCHWPPGETLQSCRKGSCVREWCLSHKRACGHQSFYEDLLTVLRMQSVSFSCISSQTKHTRTKKLNERFCVMCEAPADDVTVMTYNIALFEPRKADFHMPELQLCPCRRPFLESAPLRCYSMMRFSLSLIVVALITAVSALPATTRSCRPSGELLEYTPDVAPGGSLTVTLKPVQATDNGASSQRTVDVLLNLVVRHVESSQRRSC